MQPKIILPFLKNDELSGLGLHARYAKVAPEPIAHERVRDSSKTPNIETHESVVAYNEAVLAMLHAARFKPDATAERPHPLMARAVDPFELRLSKVALPCNSLRLPCALPH